MFVLLLLIYMLKIAVGYAYQRALSTNQHLLIVLLEDVFLPARCHNLPMLIITRDVARLIARIIQLSAYLHTQTIQLYGAFLFVHLFHNIMLISQGEQEYACPFVLTTLHPEYFQITQPESAW